MANPAAHATRTGRPLRSIVGRLLVVALLWQGPVPVIHSHASFLDAAQLADHLKRCHAADGCEDCVEGQLGGHFHFMPPRLPGEEHHDDPSAPVRPSGSTFLTAGTTAVDALLACSLSAEQPSGALPELDPASSVAPVMQSVGRTFWDHFACHLSLPMRLGVIRS